MGYLKPAIAFLLICFMQCRYAICQVPTRITLTEVNAPFSKVMDDLQAKAGVTYLGLASLVQLGHPVSFSAKDATLKEALDLCFKDQPFTYKLVEGAVTIVPLEGGGNGMAIHGRVYNANNEPLSRVTVQVSGDAAATAATDDSGQFRINTHVPEPLLIFSSVNYETQEIRGKEGRELIVQLKEKINELSDVIVLYTGFQEVRRRAVTGSFDDVNNELFNRRVGPNVLDRIDGISSGVYFNTNIVSGTNPSTITIRGRSTIFSNPNPLVVIDNFPYSGDINNINPDDVESITILKDASSASIWGALSGNGVIVITTKKGKLDQKPKLVFNTSETVGEKPNLYYLPILSTKDYIGVEQYLFGQGYYNSNYYGSAHTALTPVVNLLYQNSQGQITQAEKQAGINALSTQDFRPGLSKYFYRPSQNSQASLNLSGGGEHNHYFLSAGYDRDLSNLDRNEYDRVTVNGNNTYFLLNNRLELNTDLAFTASTTLNDNPGGTQVNYPYAQVADAHGNPLPVAYGLNEPYIDTAGGGQLLNWHYRPLQELQNADNPTRLTDYRINFDARYTILKGLDIRGYYQYGRGSSDNPDYMSQQTYHTRDLINEFTQINNGVPTYVVPLGGILVENTASYTANNVRLQLNYTDSLSRKGLLNLIGGSEIRDIEGANSTMQLFGYDPSQEIGVPVDYANFYSQYSTGTLAKIPYNDAKLGTSERYLSYYISGTYSYLGRYLLSGTLRRDESNLFEVNENQKGVPLGALGLSWHISKERFYARSNIAKWLPFLTLRITDGYNGNVDRSVSAYTTANVNPVVNNFGALNATIINPPNADLRWEKIHVVNFGADFSTRNDQFGGTVEYYLKTGLDLIGESPVDPTTGVTSFTGNTANIQDHGVDVTIHANNTFGAFRWKSILLFSYVRDKVTKYEQVQAAVNNYLEVGTLSPLAGHPLYSVYALRWEGLDHQTGDPKGFVNGTGQTPGQITEDYDSVLYSPDLSNLIYKGPVSPTYFGGWRNNLFWRQWGLSCNIVYKLGYVYRRSSIFYTYLFNGTSPGHPDYDRRWQNPGDELHTNVPSMPIPNLSSNVPRDDFYEFSEVLVANGDLVRLQDVQLTFDLSRTEHPKLPMQQLRLYLYANNLGILWKANRSGIDPDYISTVPNPRTLALGVKASF
jgi:TonB-linked SusC/RagA family outer membrane protein